MHLPIVNEPSRGLYKKFYDDIVDIHFKKKIKKEARELYLLLLCNCAQVSIIYRPIPAHDYIDAIYRDAAVREMLNKI